MMATWDADTRKPETDEYGTPKSLIRPLADAVGGFDLDPCSGAEKTPHAKETFTREDDGLTESWHGKVFCNPPFSDKKQWLQKTIDETENGDADLVVMVLPVDTSTKWFHELVSKSVAVCFMGPGRVDFDRRDKPSGNRPNFAVMLPVFGDVVPPELLGFLNTRGIVYYHRALYKEAEQTKLVTDDGTDAGCGAGTDHLQGANIDPDGNHCDLQFCQDCGRAFTTALEGYYVDTVDVGPNATGDTAKVFRIDVEEQLENEWLGFKEDDIGPWCDDCSWHIQKKRTKKTATNSRLNWGDRETK